MKRTALLGLLLAVLGCGEPKAPPPGASTDTMKPAEIELDMDMETEGNPATSPASTDQQDAPTDPSTAKDSAAGEQ